MSLSPRWFRSLVRGSKKTAKFTNGCRKRGGRRPRPGIEQLEPRILLAEAGSRSVLLLDPLGKDSLSAAGNGLISVTGLGSIGVDSRNAEDAVAAGNGQISAAAVFVAGQPGAVTKGGGKFTGPITPGAPAIPDQARGRAWVGRRRPF
jgi:hypothetical protein